MSAPSPGPLWDVIIVGAGPAGASTALHLAHDDESGTDRILLLEAACHPRDKLCGGAVTRLATPALAPLDLPDPPESIEVD
ncbi:MAG: hypothetical protein ACE5EL_03190, partial [Anaerolineae bacterium]